MLETMVQFPIEASYFLYAGTHCYICHPITGFINLLFVWSEVWGYTFPKGVNVMLPWCSSGKMLSWNVRDCGLIPHWGIVFIIPSDSLTKRKWTFLHIVRNYFFKKTIHRHQALLTQILFYMFNNVEELTLCKLSGNVLQQAVALQRRVSSKIPCMFPHWLQNNLTELHCESDWLGRCIKADSFMCSGPFITSLYALLDTVEGW